MRDRVVCCLLTSLALGLSACAESAIGNAEHDGAIDPAEGEADTGSVGSSLDAGPPTSDSGSRASDAKADARSGDAAQALSGLDAQSGVSEAAVAEAAVPDATSSTPGAAVPDAGSPFVDAAVAPACATELRRCGNQCVDTRSDNTHCGDCDRACERDETCADSVCLPEAPSDCTARAFAGHAYLLCTQTRNWRDARDACIDRGMDLTIVGSAAENDFVRSNGQSWIGASDGDDEGTWRSPVLGDRDRSDGIDLTFTAWADGEPSNTEHCDGVSLGNLCLGGSSEEDCAVVRVDGTWNDTDCDNRDAYVCEAY